MTAPTVYPLGYNQRAILRHLAKGGPLTLTEIAEDLEINRAAVKLTVRRMRRLGWVVAARAPKSSQELPRAITVAGREAIRADDELEAARRRARMSADTVTTNRP